MELTIGKSSNYNGQAKKDEKLDLYLVSLDKDIQNLWKILFVTSHLIGSQQSIINSSSGLGFSYMPIIDAFPTATPTNYTGHAAFAFCNSNSNLYIFNTSDSNWRTIHLT